MPKLVNIFDYFKCAHEGGRRPSLLEFTHPSKNTRLDICGIDPVYTLEVRNGRLYKDGQHIGSALDIFDYLKLRKSNAFFPAYIGYFAYEFAGYWGKPCHGGERVVPDAFFRLYERGLVIDGDQIIHHDPIEMTSLRPSRPLVSQSLEPGLSQEEFLALVARIKEHIREGDVYQVNLSLPFYFDAININMLDLYDAMRCPNKSPYMGVVMDDEWCLLSGSPERLFSLHEGVASARPIAGTKKRGDTLAADNAELAELQSCPKENAEHAMLVDLMRNDLHRIADESGVQVLEDRTVEFYSHVMHLVSRLSAKTTRPLNELFEALFPGGTITGAPKLSVMKSIAQLEAVPRGPYTGSLGYISGWGCDFNILIRSVVKAGIQAWINTGAGIVIDSTPQHEWSEVLKKAQAINDILQKRAQPKASRSPIRGPSIKAARAMSLATPARVLFMENQDSFSFNIIAALKSLGAQVALTHDQMPDLDGFTHVVIGPGPGNPKSCPKLEAVIEKALQAKLPLLGICLGHQALGYYFGGPIHKLPTPVHGKSQLITHSSTGLFTGLASPMSFTRYHSLALGLAPEGFGVDAYAQDDCIMAIRHHELPLYGLQFHPESYLSEGGNLLLANFLRVKSHA